MRRRSKVIVALCACAILFFVLAPVVNSYVDSCHYLMLRPGMVSFSFYLFGIGEVYYSGHFQFMTHSCTD